MVYIEMNMNIYEGTYRFVEMAPGFQDPCQEPQM